MWTGTVLVGQWLRLCASTAGGAGLIPAWGTKIPHIQISFPGDSDSQEPACSAGDPGSIPGWGRSPGEGNGHPLPWTEEPGGLTTHGVTESDTTEQLTLMSLYSIKQKQISTKNFKAQKIQNSF